ncbi:MAG: hypothetical protein ABIR26_17525 [Ramlibacter sp.]
MSRARLAARLAAEATTRFDEDVREGLEKESGRAAFIEAWVHDGMQDAEYEAACDREAFGAVSPEDTPCLQSCDFWGTGEGAHHGIIG